MEPSARGGREVRRGTEEGGGTPGGGPGPRPGRRGNGGTGRGDQIVAIPTLVRKLPEPMRRILSNTDQTLVGLQLRPLPPGER